MSGGISAADNGAALDTQNPTQNTSTDALTAEWTHDDTTSHWNKPADWANFDDVTIDHPINEEALTQSKGKDDPLSFLRPPPPDQKREPSAPVSAGGVTGVLFETSEVATLYGPSPTQLQPSHWGPHATQQGHHATQQGHHALQQGPHPTQQGHYATQQGPHATQKSQYATQEGHHGTQQGPPASQHGSFPGPFNTGSTHHTVNQITTGSPTVEPVQWLPEDSHRCHEAIRHYTGGTSTHNVQLPAMSSHYDHYNNVVVVEQPRPTDKWWSGRISPGKPPSKVYMVFTLVAAVLSVFCCLCTGLTAVVVAVQAFSKKSEGKNVEARQKLAFSLALVAASFFIFAPTIIIIVITQT